MKLHLSTRSALAIAAALLIPGAAAASTNAFEDFFESLFDDNSNNRSRASANLSIEDEEFFQASVIESISVLDAPEELEYETPERDGRRVTVVGEEPPAIYEIEEVVVEMSLGDRRVVDIDPPDENGGAHPVPEPSAALLFGLGAVVVSRRLRR